jgi:aminopeptidase N
MGSRGGMTTSFSFLATCLLAASAPALAQAAATLPEKGKPPLTERTEASGLPLAPEQKAVDFTTADLAIEVFPDRHAIAGTATLGFTAKTPLRAIAFDLDRNLPISAIALDGKPLPASAWRNPDGMVRVALPRRIAKGQSFTLTVSYAGTPHVAVNAPWDGGFVWDKTKDGKPWIATAVQGEGCDLFWPCFDNPMVEVGTVDLHITVPQDLVAPSNGVFVGLTPQPGGRHTWHWRAKHPNGYAIALNIAPYKVIEADYKSRFGNVIPMRYWYLPGEEEQAKALFAQFAPTLDFFEEMIGPYPFGDEKLGVVETPHLGMEHQTINAYGNGYKLAPEGYDWLFQHEFSHEWFGNQLTNSNWDDMWLHEGYGTYMQPLYLQWRGGEMPYMQTLWKQRIALMNRFPVVSGKPMTEEQVYNKDIGPGNDIYYKGSLVLHTLRWLIGDTAFFDATRRIVYGRPDPRPGNFTPRFASTKDYEAILRDVTGKDYSWFFDSYFRQPKLPRLVETPQGDRLTLRWESAAKSTFAMPVEVDVAGSLVTLPMSDGTGSVTVPPGVHPRIDPMSKLLRQNDEIDAYQTWKAAEDEKAKAAAKEKEKASAK